MSTTKQTMRQRLAEAQTDLAAARKETVRLRLLLQACASAAHAGGLYGMDALAALAYLRTLTKRYWPCTFIDSPPQEHPDFNRADREIGRLITEMQRRQLRGPDGSPFEHPTLIEWINKRRAREAQRRPTRRAQREPSSKGHNRRGNCWHVSVAYKNGDVNDVCGRHDAVRGDCSVCPRCGMCDAKRRADAGP